MDVPSLSRCFSCASIFCVKTRVDPSSPLHVPNLLSFSTRAGGPSHLCSPTSSHVRTVISYPFSSFAFQCSDQRTRMRVFASLSTFLHVPGSAVPTFLRYPRTRTCTLIRCPEPARLHTSVCIPAHHSRSRGRIHVLTNTCPTTCS